MKVSVALCAFFFPFILTEKRQGKDYGHIGPVYHATPIVVYHPAPPPPPPPVVVHHHPVPAPRCHTVYETRYTTKCKNINRRPSKPCVEYRKEYQTKCHIQPKTCHPVTTTVPDEACSTNTEKHCTVEVKTTYDVSYQDQCKDIEHKVCQQSQVVGVRKHPAIVGHPVIGHVPAPGHVITPAATAVLAVPAGPYHAKKAPHGRIFGGRRFHKREAKRNSRNDDREGKSYGAIPIIPRGPPQCQVKVERVCNKVPIKVPHHVEIPHCTKIPHTKCIPSFRTITDQICKDQPREVCGEVEIEIPYDVPIEYCPPVTEEVCTKVPHKYAKEVCPKKEHHY